jgi:hypothetical protein
VELSVRSPSRPRLLRSLAWLILPSVVMAGVNLATSWGTVNDEYPTAAKTDWLTDTTTRFSEACYNLYAGSTHISFVGVFGWLDTPLVIRNHPTSEIIRTIFGWFTWLLVGLTFLRLEQVCSRLLQAAWRGRRLWALRAAVSNPALNAYFLFTVVSIALYTWVDDRVAAQGRNWIPLWLPMLLVAAVYAPKALRVRTSRRILSVVVVSALLLYSVVGSAYGLRTIERRYYSPPRATETVAERVSPY